jgi:hypothetical protein
MEIEEHLEKQSWSFFGEWVKENPEFPYTTDDMIAFASFILQKRDWKKYPNEKPGSTGYYACWNIEKQDWFKCFWYEDEDRWLRLPSDPLVNLFMHIPEFFPISNTNND